MGISAFAHFREWLAGEGLEKLVGLSWR